MHIDASGFGWGGIGPGGEQAHGYFTAEQRALSSGAREMIAISAAISSFLPVLRGHHVTLYKDSTNCEAICDHGSRRAHLQKIAISVFNMCRAHDVDLKVVWVPREQNQLADALSKWVDTEDWMLRGELFQHLDRMWGPHTVDRFASDKNHLLPVFNSKFWCPGSAGVDAFALNWQGANNWCNPPFSLIGRVLTHMRMQGAVGTVIVPFWPKRPWWPLLEPRAGLWAPFVTAWWLFPNMQSVFLPGPDSGNTVGRGAPGWRVFALRVDFRPGYQRRQCIPLARPQH